MKIKLDQVAKQIYKRYGGKTLTLVVYNPSEFSNFHLVGHIKVNRQAASNLSAIMKISILTNSAIKCEPLHDL